MAFNTTNLIPHLINIDFKESNFISIPVEQYDKDSAYIEATLYDGGSPYIIPAGSTASFGGTKPSSHIILETAIIENNKVYYKISEQCTVKEGDYPVKFTLYLPNNAVKYTQEFKIKVRKAVMSSDAIADVDEVNVLNELIVNATEAIGDVNNATTNAINATNNANIKATFANEKAILADEKATLANNTAALANEKAILANEKAGLANTATTNANTATNNANTATSNANIATTNANNAANLANEKAGLANMAATNANDVATQLSNETLKIYKGAVVSYSDLATTYSNPENGWTVTVSSESASYRYNGTEWINLGVISSVGTATDTTLGVVKGSGDVHVAIDGSMSVPNKLEKTGDSKDNIITFEDYTTTTPIPSAEAALSEILSGKKHNSLWSNIKAFCNGVITVGKLANNLITTNEGLALDARQGKVLKDEVDTINNNLAGLKVIKVFAGGTIEAVTPRLTSLSSYLLVVHMTNAGNALYLITVFTSGGVVTTISSFSSIASVTLSSDNIVTVTRTSAINNWGVSCIKLYTN